MPDQTPGKSFDITYSHAIGKASAPRERGFSSPVDLAISKDWKLYVLSRVSRIGICNPDFNAEYLGHFGDVGYADGQFIWPTSVAFDKNDILYLADEYLHRITTYDKEGNFLGKWGIHGHTDGELNGPSGIAFDSEDNLYITDHLNSRIQKFTKTGKFLTKWGTYGNGDGQFNAPWGITLDSHDNVYVADWRNDRIQKFSSSGDFLAKFGMPGRGDGQLCRPASVAVDLEGYIYIADWGNERVQILDSDGNFQLKLRGESTLSKWAEEYMAGAPDEAVARAIANLEPELDSSIVDPYDESSYIEKYFWGPISVKLDTHGRLFVTESNRHRIQVYQKTN